MSRRLLSTCLSHLLLLCVLLLGAASCALNEPVTEILPNTPDAGPTRPRPVIDAGSPPVVGPPVPEEVLPTGCVNGATRACGPSTEDGACVLGQRVCAAGIWGECVGAVMPAARVCSEREDRDCDGLPDDTVDAVCQCVPGSSEPCDTHPGLDGVGACKAGQRTCVPSADGRTSQWGACTGAVGPAATDSCLVRGDDANCDAIPNTDCNCVEGEVVACGPSDVGICKRGTSTCVNSKFTQCEGAVLPRDRDCSSSEDNDCDGSPDNSVDDECTCEVDSVQACSEHPEDGVGICRAGSRTCVLSSSGTTSTFGACVGAVGPGARLCNASGDNNCDGAPDNTVDTTCACVLPSTRLCQEHPGLDGVGRCRAGTQACAASADNSSSAFGPCSGSVGPLAADLCTAPGDDSNCDGVENGGCACIAGQGNAPCAGNPAASRCDATGACVPCVANADCSAVAGRNVCSSGLCVQCTSDAQCSAGSVCNTTSRTCEALPPPEVDAGG